MLRGRNGQDRSRTRDAVYLARARWIFTEKWSSGFAHSDLAQNLIGAQRARSLRKNRHARRHRGCCVLLHRRPCREILRTENRLLPWPDRGQLRVRNTVRLVVMPFPSRCTYPSWRELASATSTSSDRALSGRIPAGGSISPVVLVPSSRRGRETASSGWCQAPPLSRQSDFSWLVSHAEPE